MNRTNSPFLSRLDATAKDTDQLLDRLLSAAPSDGELSRPARLIDAMRYSSLGGGKRFRPFLVVECAALFDVARSQALMAARLSNACIAIRWCMTICQPWTTTI